MIRSEDDYVIAANEDLAVEQLPGAGRTDDPDLAGARAHAAGPPQEHAATRAETTPPAAATPPRLRELGERVDQLHAQLAALPTRQLQRIEDLDARAHTLTTQREQLTQRLTGLPSHTGALDANRTPTRSSVPTWPAPCKPTSASSTRLSSSARV